RRAGQAPARTPSAAPPATPSPQPAAPTTLQTASPARRPTASEASPPRPDTPLPRTRKQGSPPWVPAAPHNTASPLRPTRMDKDHYDPSSTYLHSDAETGQNPLSHYTTHLKLALLAPRP